VLGIGIDSGGTHTSIALDRGEGPFFAEVSQSGTSISKARGDSVTEDAAEWICRAVAAQEDDEICVWIGAAGYSGAGEEWVVDSFERPLQILRQSGKSIEMFIANDAVSILKSPPLMGRGVAAIVGTGSVVMGVHPAAPDGVVKRGGVEWLVSDEGSGVWMTLQAIRLILVDIQQQGAMNYSSVLLDRLCNYFGVDESRFDNIPQTHRGLARAEYQAYVVSESRVDTKRRIAGFVHPHIFDLATLVSNNPHDRIAAQVVSESVRIIAKDIGEVSEVLSAYTSDTPGSRERLPLLVGGNIAAQPEYLSQLRAAVSEHKYIESIEAIGDASNVFAALAFHYLDAPSREQRAIERSFDPIHSVTKLL
jgi:N-acetylglucosamine kinase-like BadF-type ATPase